MSYGERLPIEAREVVNRQGIEDIEQGAMIARERVITLAVNVVTAALIVDREKSRAAENLKRFGMLAPSQKTPIFVFHHTVAVPFEGGRPVQTRSVLLERDHENNQTGEDKMVLHVPCDAAGDPIPDSGKLFVERIAEDNTVEYSAITKKSFYYYEPARVSKDGLGNITFDGAGLDMSRMYRRVDTHLPEIDVLNEDIINMVAVQQGWLDLDHVRVRPPQA